MQRIDYTPKKPKSLPKFSSGKRVGALNKLPTETGTYTRPTQSIPSLSTPGGSTALNQTKKYTGTAVLGIAVTHKSNLVPVFSSDEAKEISSMRR
jgi:hypothetical protein